jgi:hypothetical protein
MLPAACPGCTLMTCIFWTVTWSLLHDLCFAINVGAELPGGNNKVTHMMVSRFENQSGGSPSGHYSRWPDPWRREDDWGPITAAVMSFIILAGLIVYGSGAHL